jgi:NAD(P)-dependent dehydrogenase (short-subunit alcohol dehydrogenase family)
MTKTYLITGAGSGIGRATAQQMAQNENVNLILVGRHIESLEKTKQMLPRPDDHLCLNLDVREPAAWQNALTKFQNDDLALDGVFANAGVGGENQYGISDRWDEIISINLTGTYVTIQELLPFIKKSNSDFKHIVITSSCLARFGVPNYTAYCTAKTGLLGLTKSLALELAPSKILVNAICPGWVETEMAKAGIQKLADRSGVAYEKSFTEQMSFVPLNRISQPEEIGKFVRFLFSGEQTSITGQALDINNGSFMI